MLLTGDAQCPEECFFRYHQSSTETNHCHRKGIFAGKRVSGVSRYPQHFGNFANRQRQPIVTHLGDFISASSKSPYLMAGSPRGDRCPCSQRHTVVGDTPSVSATSPRVKPAASLTDRAAPVRVRDRTWLRRMRSFVFISSVFLLWERSVKRSHIYELSAFPRFRQPFDRTFPKRLQ